MVVAFGHMPAMKNTFILSITLACASGFSFRGGELPLRPTRTLVGIENDVKSDNRRSLLFQKLPALLVAGLPASKTNAVMQSSQDVFKVGKDLDEDQAIARFKEGQKSLQYLLDNYDQVCKGGGDNVRRYLGTVGTTSGLWGIGKPDWFRSSLRAGIAPFRQRIAGVCIPA